MGIPDTIKKIGKSDIDLWRKKYYQPANMVLSIAGNINEKLLKESIKHNFAQIRAGIKRSEPKFSTKDYSKYLLFHQKEDRPQITFSLSFISSCPLTTVHLYQKRHKTKDCTIDYFQFLLS